MQEIDKQLTKLRFDNPIIHNAITAYENSNGNISEKDILIKIIMCLAESEKHKTEQLIELHQTTPLPEGIYGVLSQQKMPDGSIDTITRHKMTTHMVAISVNGGTPSHHDETEFIIE